MNFTSFFNLRCMFIRVEFEADFLNQLSWIFVCTFSLADKWRYSKSNMAETQDGSLVILHSYNMGFKWIPFEGFLRVQISWYIKTCLVFKNLDNLLAISGPVVSLDRPSQPATNFMCFQMSAPVSLRLGTRRDTFYYYLPIIK